MSTTKRILITGATDGIGKQLALSLAKRDFELIVHGRNPEKGIKLVKELKSLNPTISVDYMNADFASLKDVNRLVDEILMNVDHIDILVNNAGVIEKSKQVTEEGFERTFVINYLSMFLFTVRIMDLLKSDSPSRIINLSSQMHSSGLDLENLQGEKHFSPSAMYAQTKLLNILFTYKLAEILHGSNITVNCLHPGVINTKLLRTLWGVQGPTSSKTLEYMVTAEELDHVTGKYYSNSQITKSSKISYDKELQDEIWELSQKYTNCYLDF